MPAMHSLEVTLCSLPTQVTGSHRYMNLGTPSYVCKKEIDENRLASNALCDRGSHLSSISLDQIYIETIFDRKVCGLLFHQNNSLCIANMLGIFKRPTSVCSPPYLPSNIHIPRAINDKMELFAHIFRAVPSL